MMHLRSVVRAKAIRHLVAVCSVALWLASCGAGLRTSGAGGGGGGIPLPSNPLAIPLTFSVRNESTSARTETIRVSVPFPQGGYQNCNGVSVVGHPTAWHVMQHWPDGTVRMAQAQFTDSLAGGELRNYTVTRDAGALTGPFVRNDWVTRRSGNLQIGAEVQDTFHSVYRTFIGTGGEVVQSTPLVRVTRHRTYHQNVSGPSIGRDFLSSTFYVTEYRDTPMMLVDWVLGNDYLGADALPNGNGDPNMRPLGVIDVMRASFMVQGMALATAYRAGEEQISAPVDIGAGMFQFTVMQNTWLADGQTRRYRFAIYLEDPAAPQIERTAWRAAHVAMVAQPLFPLASLQTWQDTAGAGLLGGPITGPADAASRGAGEYQAWATQTAFGTWGSHGEVMITGTTGTPRNTPLSPDLAHAIQGNTQRLLQKLEQLAWVQAMRPYHMWGLVIGADQDVLLWDGIPLFPGSRDLSAESFGRRALWANDPWPGYRTLWAGNENAHGWDPYDHEHWSTDALFDYWVVSDDAWAQEELRQVGQSLKGLMRLHNAYTAGIQAVRAEGWCMQGFVQCYLATGDASMKDYAIRRAREVVDVQRQKNHPSKTITIQGDYPQTGYPTTNQFFMPWQHGAVLYGYLGAYRHLEDPLFMTIAEDVVSTVEYSWVKNFNDPYLGFIPEGLRYYVPFSFNFQQIPANFWDLPPNRAHFGDSPLGGAHVFLVGGLYTLSQWSTKAQVRDKARHYAHLLWPGPDDASRWSKWTFCVLDDLVAP